MARSKLDEGSEAAAMLDEASEQLMRALAELRELARGIHPAVLTERGLAPAIVALADRAPVPVEILDLPEERLPGPTEAAAYFTVSEALTNVAKYAGATRAWVHVAPHDGHLEVEVGDDGVGGADIDAGSGLLGLRDRIAAVDGSIALESPPAAGTILRARLPLP
jgi:signal transduction histidine kinase